MNFQFIFSEGETDPKEWFATMSRLFGFLKVSFGGFYEHDSEKRFSGIYLNIRDDEFQRGHERVNKMLTFDAPQVFAYPPVVLTSTTDILHFLANQLSKYVERVEVVEDSLHITIKGITYVVFVKL